MRGGFTLVELIAVMAILAFLAAIAVTRFWSVKERGHWASIRSDLRNVATQQERYFNDHQQYSTDVTQLPDMDITNGVTITVTWTANNGWAAIGTHSSITGQCGLFVGPAPSGVAAPATIAGQMLCDE